MMTIVKQSKHEGMQRGMQQKEVEIIMKMLAASMTSDDICKLLDLDPTLVLAVAAKEGSRSNSR